MCCVTLSLLNSTEVYCLFIVVCLFVCCIVNRVVAVGQRRPLQLEDLSPLNEEDSAKHVCSTFEHHWKTQEEASGNEEVL